MNYYEPENWMVIHGGFSEVNHKTFDDIFILDLGNFGFQMAYLEALRSNAGNCGRTVGISDTQFRLTTQNSKKKKLNNT